MPWINRVEQLMEALHNASGSVSSKTTSLRRKGPTKSWIHKLSKSDWLRDLSAGSPI